MRREGIKVSHLTAAQIARYVGVSKVAVQHRKNDGTLPGEDVLGTWMAKTADCHRWIRERQKVQEKGA